MDSKRTTSKPKQNLESLLRLAVEHSGKDEEVPQTNNSEPDEQRIAFLQNALKAMTGDDFEAALLILRTESTSVEQKMNALDLVRDKIADIDLANSFVKIGGAALLLHYIRAPDLNLRPQALYIVAEMSQNNEYCQHFFHKEKLIPDLASTMNDADEEVARGSIFAISSLTQNFPLGLIEFLKSNGIKSLVSCLKSPHKSVYIKSSYLIGSLASRQTSVRDHINKQNAVSILLSNLENKDEYDDKLDATLRALSALSSSCKWSNTKDQNEQAATILKQIISNKVLLEISEDMITSSQTILDNMTKN